MAGKVSSTQESLQSPRKSESEKAPLAAIQAIGAKPRQAQRRPTKQASYELCNHAKAYLEGGQFDSGYEFLYSLLSANTSISTPAQPYIGLLAPPAYIAFASSLIVFPKTTTQSRTRDGKRGADAALRYLRCLHTIIDGPAYPTLRKALSFSNEPARRRATGRRSAAASASPEPGGDIERIAGPAANADSLWTRAEDFWHIVGWALNCSVAHKKRWSRWKLWLHTMTDFLEADWSFCIKQSKSSEADQDQLLRESLIWHYIAGNTQSPNRGSRRRIVKALLARATPEAIKEFTEIWEKETAEPKRARTQDQPSGEVDYETGQMGGYDSDEEMQDESSDVDEVVFAGKVGSTGNVQDTTAKFGGMDAIELRQRLIALLVQVAQAMPTHFTTTSDFFDNILEDFIQLPTSMFHVLLSSSKMPGHLQVGFNANLLLPLVSGTIPNYLHSQPLQHQFETLLLPLKATAQSFAANAKVSLILEQMTIYMVSQNTLTAADTLRAAVETGIGARHKALGTGRGKRGNAEEEEQARSIMEACSERLLGILEVLEVAAGKPPQPLQPDHMRGPIWASFGSGSSLSPAPDSDTEVGE